MKVLLTILLIFSSQIATADIPCSENQVQATDHSSSLIEIRPLQQNGDQLGFEVSFPSKYFERKLSSAFFVIGVPSDPSVVVPLKVTETSERFDATILTASDVENSMTVVANYGDCVSLAKAIST